MWSSMAAVSSSSPAPTLSRQSSPHSRVASPSPQFTKQYSPLQSCAVAASQYSPLQSCAVAASPELLGQSLHDAVFRGVMLWNKGDYNGCTDLYRQVCEQWALSEPRLAEAVQRSKGKPSGSAMDSQGWILRAAMDEVLAEVRARQVAPFSEAKSIRPQALQHLQTVFPHLSASQVEAALRRCGGEEQRAKEILVNVQPMSSSSERTVSPGRVAAVAVEQLRFNNPVCPPGAPAGPRRPSTGGSTARDRQPPKSQTPDFGVSVSPEFCSRRNSAPDVAGADASSNSAPDFVLACESWFKHADPLGQGLEPNDMLSAVLQLYHNLACRDVLEDLVRRAWPRNSQKMIWVEFSAPGGLRDLLLARLGEPELPRRMPARTMSRSVSFKSDRPSTPPRSKFGQKLTDATKFSASLQTQPATSVQNSPCGSVQHSPGSCASLQTQPAGSVQVPPGSAAAPPGFQPARPSMPPRSEHLGRRPSFGLGVVSPVGHGIRPDSSRDAVNNTYRDMSSGSQSLPRNGIGPGNSSTFSNTGRYLNSQPQPQPQLQPQLPQSQLPPSLPNASAQFSRQESLLSNQSAGFHPAVSFDESISSSTWSAHKHQDALKGVQLPLQQNFCSSSFQSDASKGVQRSMQQGSGSSSSFQPDAFKVGPLPSVSGRSVSSQGPRRRALLVGINYTGSQAELKGSINDVRNMNMLLTDTFGWSFSSIRVLTDDNPAAMPTRSNILAALQWLSAGARPGDVVIFHFSGHGAQQRDANGQQEHGMNEAILPCDFSQSGMIIDDLICELLVRRLPEQSRLTCLLDCCHTGTGLDLPYKWTGRTWLEETNPCHMFADVQLFTGFEGGDCSADANMLYAAPGGAMTTAFCDVLRETPCLSYPELMNRLNQLLRMRGLAQQAQLTSSQRFDFQRQFTLTDIVANSNTNTGRKFRRKFPPKPRQFTGPLKVALKTSALVLGGLVMVDSSSWMGGGVPVSPAGVGG